MVASNHNPSILLKRVLSLTDFSPLILCVDSIGQTAKNVIDEVVFNAKGISDVTIIFVSFETINIPQNITHFIEADSITLEKLTEVINSYLPSSQQDTRKKHLVILDSANYIPRAHVSQFIASISSPVSSLVAVYHADMPEHQDNRLDHYPSSLELLRFMATTIIEVNPALPKNTTEEQLKLDLLNSFIRRGLNNSIFEISFTNRRKSGRSLVYNFQIDSKRHFYETITGLNDEKENTNESPEMLQGLTTFNLSTSAKQKLAKEQVELPFLEAQSFNTGGAIVYQYEKDDDYDEEDPYEDPF